MVLPDQQFFKPTDDFIIWLSNRIQKKAVIEVGAGQGHFSKILLNRGVNTIPLDIHERDTPVTNVVITDAIEFNYPKGSIVLIARPNRGDWIQDVIKIALRSGSDVYYIAKPERVSDDVFDLVGNELPIYYNAGTEKEEVYLFSAKEPTTMNTYYLITWNHGTLAMGPSWMTKEGNKWVNSGGGGFWDEKVEVIETVTVEDWEDLDWSKTSLAIRPEGTTSGWISPAGKFYPCDSRDHDDYAYWVLKKNVHELEDAGWVRTGGIRPHIDSYSDYQCRAAKLTAEQRNRLSLIGYILKESDE